MVLTLPTGSNQLKLDSVDKPFHVYFGKHGIQITGEPYMLFTDEYDIALLPLDVTEELIHQWFTFPEGDALSIVDESRDSQIFLMVMRKSGYHLTQGKYFETTKVGNVPMKHQFAFDTEAQPGDSGSVALRRNGVNVVFPAGIIHRISGGQTYAFDFVRFIEYGLNIGGDYFHALPDDLNADDLAFGVPNIDLDALPSNASDEHSTTTDEDPTELDGDCWTDDPDNDEDYLQRYD